MTGFKGENGKVRKKCENRVSYSLFCRFCLNCEPLWKYKFMKTQNGSYKTHYALSLQLTAVCFDNGTEVPADICVQGVGEDFFEHKIKT